MIKEFLEWGLSAGIFSRYIAVSRYRVRKVTNPPSAEFHFILQPARAKNLMSGAKPTVLFLL